MGTQSSTHPSTAVAFHIVDEGQEVAVHGLHRQSSPTFVAVARAVEHVVEAGHSKETVVLLDQPALAFPMLLLLSQIQAVVAASGLLS